MVPASLAALSCRAAADQLADGQRLPTSPPRGEALSPRSPGPGDGSLNMDKRSYSIARIVQLILSNKISISKLHWHEGCSLALRAEGRMEADYVPGCDGTRSVIRDAIGAGLDGSDDGRRNVNVVRRWPRMSRRAVRALVAEQDGASVLTDPAHATLGHPAPVHRGARTRRRRGRQGDDVRGHHRHHAAQPRRPPRPRGHAATAGRGLRAGRHGGVAAAADRVQPAARGRELPAPARRHPVPRLQARRAPRPRRPGSPRRPRSTTRCSARSACPRCCRTRAAEAPARFVPVSLPGLPYPAARSVRATTGMTRVVLRW